MRRLIIGIVGGALTVTACAGSDSTSSDPTPAPVTEAPASEPAAAPETTAVPDGAEGDTTAPEPTAAPEPEPEAEPAPEAEPEPEPTTTLAPEPVSTPLGGRDLGEALRPESADGSNPLPDLGVDDIRRGTTVNVANIIPSALPVLVWAWAPH